MQTVPECVFVPPLAVYSRVHAAMHAAFLRHRDRERRLEPACLCDMTCRIDLTPEVLVCVQCVCVCLNQTVCAPTPWGFGLFILDHYGAQTTREVGDTAVFIDMFLTTVVTDELVS